MVKQTVYLQIDVTVHVRFAGSTQIIWSSDDGGERDPIAVRPSENTQTSALIMYSVCRIKVHSNFAIQCSND